MPAFPARRGTLTHVTSHFGQRIASDMAGVVDCDAVGVLHPTSNSPVAGTPVAMSATATIFLMFPDIDVNAVFIVVPFV